MRGPTRVEFMPIKHGDMIDISGMENHTSVHVMGFKPGPARSRAGWLVLLVHEGTVRRKASWPNNGRTETVSIPKAASPRKLRPQGGPQ